MGRIDYLCGFTERRKSAPPSASFLCAALIRIRSAGISDNAANGHLPIAKSNGFRVDRAFLDDDALAASSDRPSVLFTAFRGGNDYAHLLSLGAVRSTEVTGVPDVDWRVSETIDL